MSDFTAHKESFRGCARQDITVLDLASVPWANAQFVRPDGGAQVVLSVVCALQVTTASKGRSALIQEWGRAVQPQTLQTATVFARLEPIVPLARMHPSRAPLEPS